MIDPSLAALLPTGGVASVLVVVIVYLLRQNATDRRDGRAALKAAQEQHVAEVKALEERHVAELAGVRKELGNLATQVKDTLEQFERERRLRWRAEDRAADYRRRLAQYVPDLEPEVDPEENEKR